MDGRGNAAGRLRRTSGGVGWRIIRIRGSIAAYKGIRVYLISDQK